MKRVITSILCIIVMAMISTVSTAAAGAEYAPGLMYVKYSSGIAKNAMSSASVPDMLQKYGALEAAPAFSLPDVSSVQKTTARYLASRVSLESISLVSFPSDTDIPYLAKKLSARPDIEYAEPVYIAHTTAVPDDYYYDRTGSSQNQYDMFRLLRAESAWDIAKGDSTVVIAIVDSGTDWNHPDLYDNLWTNDGEIPDNNTDDDGNRKIDDEHGWDFYGGETKIGAPIQDNDPTSTQEPHGTHVAGIAAGVTNNGTGIASLSWNVEYMPVKTSPDVGEEIYYGYQGIRYAADSGADIINCSWGSEQYSETGMEAIEYARSVNENIIIVAAAGNSGTDTSFYPAAYPGVLAVGAIDFSIDDNVITTSKASFSNYGAYIDVAAPGTNINSTLLKDGTYENSYGLSSGTSMAAPVVSALAGLLKSAHPDWDADRIQGQIAGTARQIGDQSPMCYLCGTGYIDAEGALGVPVTYIDILTFAFTDENSDNDGQYRPGETIEASITVHNYGNDVQNATASLSSLTGYTSPVSSSISIGSLAHGEEKTFDNIRFTVTSDAAADGKEFIRVDFKTADADLSFGVIETTVNPSYYTISQNTISLSVDGAGHIGYLNYPENTKGSAFVLTGESLGDTDVYGVPLLFEGGLMVGTAQNSVSNSVRGDDQTIPDEDFTVVEPFTTDPLNNGNGQKATVVFNDDGAGDDKIGVTVTMDTYAYNDEGHDQYMILAYTFANPNTETVSNIHAGLFLDFDLGQSSDDDLGFYDSENDILVIQESNGSRNNSFMVGGAMVEGIATPWLIENAYELSARTYTIGDEFGIYDGFLKAEKWTALSSGKTGLTEVGPEDISMVLSSGAFSLAPEESHQVVFVLAWGLGADELTGQISNALTRATDLETGVADSDDEQQPFPFALSSVYPNPFNPRTVVSFSLPEDDTVTLKMYDILGRTVRTLTPGRLAAGEHSVVLDANGLASGIYILGLSGESGRHAYRKITLLK